MKKLFIGFFVFSLLAAVIYYGAIVLIGGMVIDAVDDEADSYKAHIGEVYVLDGDSLKIIDYSMINETYTLSNGVEVNKALIEK